MCQFYVQWLELQSVSRCPIDEINCVTHALTKYFCLFVCLFIDTSAIFQLSGGCHHYQSLPPMDFSKGGRAGGLSCKTTWVLGICVQSQCEIIKIEYFWTNKYQSKIQDLLTAKYRKIRSRLSRRVTRNTCKSVINRVRGHIQYTDRGHTSNTHQTGKELLKNLKGRIFVKGA
jgi:hypothetical protein